MALHHAVDALPRGRIVQSENYSVVIRVEGSWKSFGEEVRVELQGDSDGTHVTVSSSPLVASLVDYGKNQSNVDVLVEALSAADQRYRSTHTDR